MQNKIYPHQSGNFTVIGLYPHNIPSDIRAWITNNKTECAILRKHNNAFYLSSISKLPPYHKNCIEWTVYPAED